MSIESVMPSNHLILCHPLLLPSIFPNIRFFSNESVLPISWPKYWSFSFNISPSNEYSGLISFKIDWFDLLAVHTHYAMVDMLCLHLHSPTQLHHEHPFLIHTVTCLLIYPLTHSSHTTMALFAYSYNPPQHTFSIHSHYTLTSLKDFSPRLCLSSTFPSPYTPTHPSHTASPPPTHTITPLPRRPGAQNLNLGKNFTVKELLSWLL